MKKIFILVLLVCLSLSCDEQDYQVVPLMDVRMTLDLAYQDADLNAVFAYKTFTQRRAENDRIGYGGLLIIHGVGAEAINLYAFDLTCPVEIAQGDDEETGKTSELVRVVPNDEGEARCPKCGTVYNISGGIGNPNSGSKIGLRRYRVTPRGDRRYYVSN
ncbi:hypothetical protein LJC06_01515 [Bacteroidales bacterium OttesenSCG-928-I14]|nr:hypothetical protein [Bacteroidales bacterium OttesenSCG-928-I14]